MNFPDWIFSRSLSFFLFCHTRIPTTQVTVVMAMITQERIASKYIAGRPSRLLRLTLVSYRALFGAIIAQVFWLGRVCLRFMGRRYLEWWFAESEWQWFSLNGLPKDFAAASTVLLRKRSWIQANRWYSVVGDCAWRPFKWPKAANEDMISHNPSSERCIDSRARIQQLSSKLVGARTTEYRRSARVWPRFSNKHSLFAARSSSSSSACSALVAIAALTC